MKPICRNIVLLALIFPFGGLLLCQAQINCDSVKFDEILERADQNFEDGDFELALDRYQAAADYCPQRKEIVDARLRTVYDSLQKLRKDAEDLNSQYEDEIEKNRALLLRLKEANKSLQDTYDELKKESEAKEKAEEDALDKAEQADVAKAAAINSEKDAKYKENIAQKDRQLSIIKSLASEAINLSILRQDQNRAMLNLQNADSINNKLQESISSDSLAQKDSLRIQEDIWSNQKVIYQAMNNVLKSVKTCKLLHQADLNVILPINQKGSLCQDVLKHFPKSDETQLGNGLFFILGGDNGFLELLVLELPSLESYSNESSLKFERIIKFKLPRGAYNQIRAAAVDLEQHWLLAGDNKGRIYLWNIEEALRKYSNNLSKDLEDGAKLELKKYTQTPRAQWKHSIKLDQSPNPIKKIYFIQDEQKLKWVVQQENGKLALISFFEGRLTKKNIGIEAPVYANSTRSKFAYFKSNSVFLMDRSLNSRSLGYDLSEVKLDTNSITALTFDESILVAGTHDGEIFVFKIDYFEKSLKLLSDHKLHTAPIVKLVLHPQQNWIVSLAKDQVISILNLRTIASQEQEIIINNFDIYLEHWGWDIVYLPDSQNLAVVGVQGIVSLFTPEYDQLIEYLENSKKVMPENSLKKR